MERAVTGIGWLDWLAVAAFVAVTAFSLARLVVPRRPDRPEQLNQHFHDDAFHAVMGVAMVAMFWPGGGRPADPAWVAVIGLTAVWPLLVFARASHAVRVSRAFRANRAAGAEQAPGPTRAATGRTGYYLASALVMIVAFAAGPGSMAPGPLRSMAMGALASPGLQAAKHPAAQGALSAAAGWPIWPLVGAVFVLYGAWLAIDGRRRPTPQLACTMVMAAGMAFMAFSI
jgi:Domain of unknown function (DUF5134)